MSEDYLRRYTDLTALMYLLHKRKITLLDPASWDDKNDSHYLTQYKGKRNLKSVLALCLMQSDERYHHWSVFAPGPSGVCIKFKRDELLSAVRKHEHIHMHPVTYMTLSEIRRKKLKVAELPFLKRHAFEHEDEFRIIYTSVPRYVCVPGHTATAAMAKLNDADAVIFDLRDNRGGPGNTGSPARVIALQAKPAKTMRSFGPRILLTL